MTLTERNKLQPHERTLAPEIKKKLKPGESIRRRFNGIEIASSGGLKSAPIPVLILFAIAIFDAIPIPGFNVPVASIALLLVVSGAVFFRPVAHTRPLWFLMLVAAIPVWFVITSLLNDHLDWRRIFSISLWAAVILVISSGRVPPYAVGRGLGLGIFVGGISGILLIPVSSYENRLTGWFSDPNGAGLLLSLGICLSMPYLTNKRTRIAVLVVGVSALVLTFSRTSYLAAVLVIAWMVLGGKVNKYLGAAVLAVTVYAVTSLPQETFQFGIFKERGGSDDLRARIEELEITSVENQPWIGGGAGSARIHIQDQTFFFHNSYLALRAEAGFIGFCLVMGLLVAVFIALIALPNKRRSVWMESSAIALAMCAANIGEALLTNVCAIMLGLAGYHIATQRKIMRNEAEEARQERWANRLRRGQVAGKIS